MSNKGIFPKFVVIAVLLAIAGCNAFSKTKSPPFQLGGDQLRAPSTQASSIQWLDNWELAASQAERDSKIIIANFTGSDWCSWCQRLDKEVFDTPEFSQWASSRAVLLKVDFPKRKQLTAEVQQQNERLAEMYKGNIKGYPTILVLDSSGKVLGQLGYLAGGPENWTRAASNFIPYQPN